MVPSENEFDNPTYMEKQIKNDLSKLICLEMFGSNNKLLLSLACIAVMHGYKQWLLCFSS